MRKSIVGELKSKLNLEYNFYLKSDAVVLRFRLRLWDALVVVEIGTHLLLTEVLLREKRQLRVSTDDSLIWNNSTARAFERWRCCRQRWYLIVKARLPRCSTLYNRQQVTFDIRNSGKVEQRKVRSSVRHFGEIHPCETSLTVTSAYVFK